MPDTTWFVAARTLRAMCFMTLLLGAGVGLAYATDGTAPASGTQNTSPQALQSVPAGVPNNALAPSPAGAPKAAPAQPASKPLWTDLTPTQQQALAPLAAEWDKLSSARKSKWLVIGNKYASMKPDEQQRVQARMREWVSLTPEQRRIARESYARAKKLNSNQKSEHWEKYQQLPEEQKKKLAADATSKKHVATLPPASQAKTKTVPPIKSTPKPVLEQSVTPQAASQSAISPSPQPASK
jgi:hypothetical protein